VARKAVQLFSDAENVAGDGLAIFYEEMANRADGSAFLRTYNYNIPRRKTTYEDVCYTASDMVDLGLYEDLSSTTHIIGFEFLVDPSSRKYLHHILLYGHLTSACSFWSGQVVAAWTPGNDFIFFPEGMGLEVGGDIFKAFMLQYHFSNVDGDVGEIDDGSGVKIHFSNEPVDIEVGMAVMGDFQLSRSGLPIGQGKTMHQFICPPGCADSTFVNNDEVTVIAEGHHMHQKGKRMVGEVMRGGEVVNTAVVDYWDFDQNGVSLVRQEPYVLKKGDSYRATCYFESNSRNVVWGEASFDEMCMTFLYYYPKQPQFLQCSPDNFQKECRSSYSVETLDSESNFDRPVTDVEEVPPLPGGLCFSGETAVQAFDNRFVKMKDLEVGQKIRSSTTGKDDIFTAGRTLMRRPLQCSSKSASKVPVRLLK